MKHAKHVLTSFVLIACLSSYTWAGLGITVDGDLSDWGVTPFTDWDPSSPTADYQVGDNINTYNAKGYNEHYDLEALYFDDDQDKLYVAAVTSYTDAYIGDIFFDLDGDMNVDTHGQATGFDAAVRIGSEPGLVSNVFPNQVISVAEAMLKQGGTELGNNTFAFTNPVLDGDHLYQGSPYQVAAGTGTSIGDAEVAYKDIDSGDVDDPEKKTRVFELAISRSLLPHLDIGDEIGVHFTMWCGNDSLNLPGDIDTDVTVPAPSAAFLAGLGTLLVNRFRKRRLS